MFAGLKRLIGAYKTTCGIATLAYGSHTSLETSLLSAALVRGLANLHQAPGFQAGASFAVKCTHDERGIKCPTNTKTCYRGPP